MFSSALAGMDSDKGASLVSALESGTFFDGLDMETLTKEQFADRLNTYGMDSGLVGLTDRAKNDELGMIIDGLPTELKDSYGAIIEMFGTFFDTRDGDRPDWYT